jgi:hypothetical protein
VDDRQLADKKSRATGRCTNGPTLWVRNSQFSAATLSLTFAESNGLKTGRTFLSVARGDKK